MRFLLINFLTVFLLTPSLALGFRVGGLQSPASFIVDPALGHYFISNISGKPLDRDHNGFILKLDASGQPLLSISGKNKKTTLHAPEGLALKRNILYVTDIDSLRWFDKNTGNSLGHIDLTGIGAQHLKGLAFDDEENLYLSDVLVNAIYKVETRNHHKITVFIKDNRLDNPSGMVFDPVRKRLIVVTRASGQILGVGMDKKIVPAIAKTFKHLYGVGWGRAGNLLVSDQTGGKIYRIRNFSHSEIVRENILTPAGLSFDYARNLILVPSAKGNLAFTIP